MTREEAIHFAECLKHNWTIDFNDMEDFCDMVIEALSQPIVCKDYRIDDDHIYCSPKTADIVVKALSDRPTGEWIPNHDGSWNCSECGLRVLVYAKGNFCPNCGADMRKGGDDE